MIDTAKPTPNHLLRHERERRCWSQQELADKVGTTPLNVSRWERGITLPNPYFRQKLCEVFEKSAQQLGLIPENAFEQKPPRTAPAANVPDASPPQETPTSLWNIPYRRNPLFTGREDVLDHLHDALTSEEQPIALTQPHAISGLGGIGKTQTAVEYAHRYRDNYTAILWARADTYDLLVSDFLLIANLLNLAERNEQDQSMVVNAVMRWFSSHKQWLLILDNADNLAMVSEFIPSAGRGHVLLTTRAQSTGTVAQRIELDKMGLDEGTLFLLRRTKRLKGAASLELVPTEVRTQTQAIVEEVDGLPLALDQAGAYIEETGCSLADYLKFYKTRRSRLLRTRGRDATGHPEPVATTWSLSFEKVERANPAAAELLRLCAFLHPDTIPEAMIVEGASELGSILQPIAEDELELNEAIGELRKYSLVKRDPEGKILNIHRLVQAVLKDGMEKDIQREWAERTVRVVNQAFPKPEKVEIWPVCQQYLPHAQICTEIIEQWKITFAEASRLLSNIGGYLRERGQYVEAEPLLQQALRIREQTLGAEHLDVAASLNQLSQLYYLQGRYTVAESLIQKALTIHEKILGSEHLEVATDLHYRAIYYSYQSKYELAEPFHLRSLAIFERVLGSEHPDVAGSLNSLAMLYQYQGKYIQAEQLHQRALEIDEKALGPDHPDVASDLNNLAILYYKQGKYLQAEQLRQRVLRIVEKALGPEHLYVSISLINLAVLYVDLGKYEEAESLAQRSLRIVEKILGPDHPEAAFSLNCLALINRAKGSYAQAELLFQQALAIREQALGAENPDVAQTLNGLALLYHDQGKYEQAEPLFQQALVIREQKLGPEHPDVAQTLNGLALLYCVQDKHEQAESLFQRALIIREQSLGLEHPHIATTLENYAALLRKTGRETEAIALETRAQAIQAKQH